MAERRIKAILEAQDRASPAFSRVSGAVKALGVVAAAVGVQQIGRQLVRGLQSAVSAAAEYESAAVRLNVALANQGQLTPQTSKAFRTFARDLTDVSLATETQILSAIAQAKALGASDKAARDLTTAAVDLAAATGVEMETAFRQINRTLGGYAGELGEVIPELKTLTSEQLRAGGAAAILQAKFEGAGAAGAKTFAGSVNNLNSAMEQVRREIGGPFSEVLTAVNNDALLPLAKQVRDNIAGTTQYRQVVLETALAIAQLAQAAFRVTEPLIGIATIVALTKFAEFRDEIVGVTKALNAIGGEGVETPFDALVTSLKELIEKGPQAAGAAAVAATAIGAAVEEADAKAQPWLVSLIQLQEETRRWREEMQLANETAELHAEAIQPLLESGDALRESITAVADAARLQAEVLDLFINQAVTSMGETVKKAKQFEREIQNAIAQLVINSLALLAQLFGQEKAFRIAQAIINTAVGVTRALADLRYPLNFIVAASIAAAGATEIATITNARFQRGGIVPGINQGGDTATIQAQPGEAVLPRQLTEFLLQAASRGFGGGAEVIELRMDEGIVARRLSDGVQRGSVRLVASRLRDARVTR